MPARPLTLRRRPKLRVVFVTAPAAEAEALGTALVSERLAACANLLPGVTSIYWWDGKVQRDGETLLVLKTPARNLKRLLRRLGDLHSYEVPEFLSLPVREGSESYLNWVRTETKRKRAR